MDSHRILVALATYNEIANLPGLVDEILRVLPGADILVVDDNSPDGTGGWCDERAKTEPRLRCLHRPDKQGLGLATVAAMRYAIEHGYELFVTLDADWSHDPRHLSELIAAAEETDVAIGSRYCRGGGIDGWPLHRRVMSLDVARVQATGYAYLEEILWHLHRAGATFVEVPITFHERRAGESKVSVGEAAGKLATLVRLAVARK
jgi:dolichol-phosphate mannosyltransferase